jgi:hypothetical protein
LSVFGNPDQLILHQLRWGLLPKNSTGRTGKPYRHRKVAVFVYPIDSILSFFRYSTMSLLAKRMLPPTLINGRRRSCCNRRTVGTEILNSFATSAMVSSSIIE